MAGIKGLVSVIIPTYNRADRISASVLSCFNQTYSEVEVVVVDDGSSDHTSTVINELKSVYGDRLVFVKQKNSGACMARNRGLEIASGEFIQFLDSDDLLDPRKFEIQIQALLKTDADVAVCDFKYVNAANELIREVINNVDLKQKVASFGSLSVFTPLIRKSSLHPECKWNPTIIRNQDMDFMFRYFLTVSKWIYTPGFFCTYVFHDEERISDSYSQGVQYCDLVKSAYQFMKQYPDVVLNENLWMINELAYNIARILNGQKKIFRGQKSC